MNPAIRETVIGIASASFSMFILLTLIGGGIPAGLADAVLLVFFASVAPVIYLSVTPWLLIVYGLAGYLIFDQYRRIELRFMRYLVGAEALVWQIFGIWCIGSLAAT